MRHRQFSLPDFCNHFTEERIRTLLLRPEMKREYFGHGESLLIESINRMSFFETGNYLLWEKATFFKSSGKVVIENKNDDPLENHSATAYQNWVIETFLSDSVGDIRVEKKNLEGKLAQWLARPDNFSNIVSCGGEALILSDNVFGKNIVYRFHPFSSALFCDRLLANLHVRLKINKVTDYSTQQYDPISANRSSGKD
ncbi:unnamed protein product [Oikopleura dioica]|uniref:Uncharacterized protein n=1 Tax=Oikopleura dioica TaxID=34765 RepID=E4Y3R3_OIKDI|nr:unnamed protein product [Oikopleura dioica]